MVALRVTGMQRRRTTPPPAAAPPPGERPTRPRTGRPLPRPTAVPPSVDGRRPAAEQRRPASPRPHAEPGSAPPLTAGSRTRHSAKARHPQTATRRHLRAPRTGTDPQPGPAPPPEDRRLMSHGHATAWSCPRAPNTPAGSHRETGRRQGTHHAVTIRRHPATTQPRPRAPTDRRAAARPIGAGRWASAGRPRRRRCPLGGSRLPPVGVRAGGAAGGGEFRGFRSGRTARPPSGRAWCPGLRGLFGFPGLFRGASGVRRARASRLRAIDPSGLPGHRRQPGGAAPVRYRAFGKRQPGLPRRTAAARPPRGFPAGGAARKSAPHSSPGFPKAGGGPRPNAPHPGPGFP